MKIRGLHTAIVTPFTKSGELDVPAFERLIDMQIDAGVDGVVVCGSTGEGATLSMEEKQTLWRTAVERAAGRITVTAGTGTNDTRSTIDLSVKARQCGVDAVLVVTPYYNKPTSVGLVAHFRAIADATDVPMIMYNVPGRTGQNVSAETQLAVAEACPTVVATKEASANLEQMCQIIRHARTDFALLAGDDVLTLPAIACGAQGVIAVISNYAPTRFGRLVRAALDGDLPVARKEQMYLMAFFAANFIESNPIPVKHIMHMLGHIDCEFRLPLCRGSEATQETLRTIMKDFVDA
ncbi:MAG: hypothetical protein RIR53_1478 [Bacteroidota bacterium]|jgi:4-hydroxy-tetrahydrodipicolinate synthase